MVVVLDVISVLEKHPITKEALEETRLGKLINDVRRKTKNEDLAKRAKKLLRNWQKLIEPGSGETLTKTNHCNASWSSSGSLPHSQISSSNITTTTNSRKAVCELKSRNDFNNSNIMEKANRKRKGDKNELKTAKKTKHNSKPSKSNCRKTTIKPLSTSLLLKASVVQQQATTRGQHSTKTHCATLNQETAEKPQVPNLQTVRQDAVDISEVRTAKNNVESLNPSSCSSSLKDAKKKQKYLKKCEKVKSKDRKLTFDPITCQIKHNKELDHDVEPKPSIDMADVSKNQVASNSLQQNDWKELSKIESIKSYLNHQSSVLSSMSHTPHSSLSTIKEPKDDQNTHKLSKEDTLPTDLPGVNRELTKDDMDKLHRQQWAGVNGCFDNKGSWFDWTQCISLDLHNDGSKLDILPYVCLD